MEIDVLNFVCVWSLKTPAYFLLIALNIYRLLSFPTCSLYGRQWDKSKSTGVVFFSKYDLEEQRMQNDNTAFVTTLGLWFILEIHGEIEGWDKMEEHSRYLFMAEFHAFEDFGESSVEDSPWKEAQGLGGQEGKEEGGLGNKEESGMELWPGSQPSFFLGYKGSRRARVRES